ncbi:hypothetical protein [Deinococcus aestuarii]|uniref:hypothetical protein n=1 Tax=Deinococcus aestuarii TaxID=2774531 RepID=UPI001C0B49C6|nr:hypothetical protein [Deinococcus aestuarii]
MHPALSRQLLREQLQEALDTEGFFSPEMELVEDVSPDLYIRFTNLQGQARLLHFECTDYDFQAIQVRPVDPTTREPLSPHGWMTRNAGSFPSHQMLSGPFLCLQGTRDYYTHEGHRPSVTGERWELWRAELPLARLLHAIKGKFATGEWA